MESIKNSALKIRLFFESKRYKHQRVTKNYHDAKEVGILFSAESAEDIKPLKKFVQELISDGKKVRVLVFHKNIAETEIENHTKNDFTFFSSRDISLVGDIKSEHIKEFVSHKYDYLCCVSSEHHLIFERILTLTDSCCRIGNYFLPAQNLFELTIEAEDSTELSKTFGNILHYWKNISQNALV